MCSEALEVSGHHWRAMSKDKDIYLHVSDLTFKNYISMTLIKHCITETKCQLHRNVILFTEAARRKKNLVKKVEIENVITYNKLKVLNYSFSCPKDNVQKIKMVRRRLRLFFLSW